MLTYVYVLIICLVTCEYNKVNYPALIGYAIQFSFKRLSYLNIWP